MTVRAYKLGSLGQDDLTGIQMVAAYMTAPGSTAGYMTLENPVGTDYQVPAGQTYYITSLHISVTDTTAINVVRVGYGDNGVSEGASAPTNYVELTGSFSTGNKGTLELNVLIPIPAQKYPCMRIVTGTPSSLTAYGIVV